MNAQVSPTLVSRRVVRVIRLTFRPKSTKAATNAAPARGGDVGVHVAPFIHVDPDAQPGRGRLGHCY